MTGMAAGVDFIGLLLAKRREGTAREREGLGRRPSARIARIGFGWTVFIHRAWISWERPHTAR